MRELVRKCAMNFGIEREKYGLFWQKKAEFSFFRFGLSLRLRLRLSFVKF
jgi:hypothetical protein